MQNIYRVAEIKETIVPNIYGKLLNAKTKEEVRKIFLKSSTRDIAEYITLFDIETDGGKEKVINRMIEHACSAHKFS